MFHTKQSGSTTLAGYDMINAPEFTNSTVAQCEIIQIDLRSVGLGRRFLPLFGGESPTWPQDVARIKKAILRERKMFDACKLGFVQRDGTVSKDARKHMRAYLRSHDCLMAQMFQASTRRAIRKRQSLRRMIQSAGRYQVTKALPEKVYVSIKEKPDGGHRKIMDFGPVARGAQSMCAKLLKLNLNYQPFQCHRLGHVAKVQRAIELITKGGYTHYLEIDIIKHYDSFDREMLMACLPIPENATRHIICAASAEHVFPPLNPNLIYSEAQLPTGLPQGGPVSGTVADWSVSRMEINLGQSTFLINHADNFFLFAKSKAALDAGRNALSLAITQLPGGSFLSACKSEGLCSDGFTMLGYDIAFPNGELFVHQVADKADEFVEKFDKQFWLANGLFLKSLQEGQMFVRIEALQEFCRLKPMLEGWKNIQKICTHSPDPVQGEMEDRIRGLQKAYKITADEIIAATDPYSQSIPKSSITS